MVSVQIQNPTISEFKFQERDYKKLLDWKKHEFDPKFKVELKKAYDKYMYLEIVSETVKRAV